MHPTARSILTAAFAAFALTAAPALAQDASDACWDKAVTQRDLTDCAARDMDAAEIQMNTLYAIVLDKFRGDPETLGKIRAAQQAWLAFREAHVAAVYPKADTPDAQYEYGSSLSMCMASVAANLTGPRIAQLRDWADGIPEGDVCAGSRGSTAN
ncbi:lysozyme inhibitor LprI family protein [Hwanghaeella grinnelliae]|nr:lysozyme inhibitor LprI family protein [Hwanghaeella grinnelliae]